MVDISKQKNGNDELIPRFLWHFSAQTSPNIIIKHNIKKTAIKRNIWGPYYITKC